MESLPPSCLQQPMLLNVIKIKESKKECGFDGFTQTFPPKIATISSYGRSVGS